MASQVSLQQPSFLTFADFQAQSAVQEGLLRTLREGRFVHAYLISGLEGVGKRSLARLIAQSLLCMGQEKPCGVCSACVQVREGQHPDLVWVAPGQPLNPEVRAGLAGIPVDEIRFVLEIVGRHTFAGGNRVVVVERAEKMNAAAQNALLKTLEEPVAGTVFLLLSDSPELLLPTIVSRCRALKLHPWPDKTVLTALRNHGVPEERAQAALHVCGGSIGRALAVAADEGYWQRRDSVMQDFFALQSRSDILRVSTAWKDRKEDALELLDDVEDLLRSLLLVRLGQRDARVLASYPEAWQRMAREAELSAFLRLQDAVCEARRMRLNQVTWQAVVEKLLLCLMEEKNKWST